jgi:uncharacterized membrane protein YbhN (UPF0104 family)
MGIHDRRILADLFCLWIAVVARPPLIGVVLAARLAFLLPLPGALGALESSQVLMLSTFALDPSIGLTVCLIMRARDLLLVGVGTGLVWSWLHVN